MNSTIVKQKRKKEEDMKRNGKTGNIIRGILRAVVIGSLLLAAKAMDRS